jgi:hypothetical protein
MESIIDSESTSHVSEEAPIDSFVQLPETESDCHQSDHVMEFHLNIINVLFFSFIEEINFNTWELFKLPRCPARGPGPLR